MATPDLEHPLPDKVRQMLDTITEHEVVQALDSESTFITEVALHYTVADQSYQLSVDPGELQVLLWDDDIFELYKQGLNAWSQPAPVPITVNPEGFTPNGPAPYVAKTPASIAFLGVKGHIRYQTDSGQWYEVGPQCISSEIVVYYRRGDMDFQVRLPTLSGNGAANAEPHDVGVPRNRDRQHLPLGVDAFFWNAESCKYLRSGFALAGRNLDHHHCIRDDDNMERLPSDEVRRIIRPIYPARPGAFHTQADPSCTHFCNCEWYCALDAQ